jgi:hypothetical protein
MTTGEKETDNDEDAQDNAVEGKLPHDSESAASSRAA